jgi:CheY-like chemotaxis protein
MNQGDAFAPGDALRSVEVLYVDPDPHRRDILRRMILALGARRVQVAEAGDEALKVVLGTQAGLVVIQHNMAPMNGIALVRKIRAVGNYPRALVPTVILGDPVGSDVLREALMAGANLFLVRPISPAKLYERLSWVLNDPRPFGVKDGHYLIKPPSKASQRASA